MEGFEKPQDVTDLDLAFGGEMKTLLPPYEDIPAEFKRHRGNKWVDFQNDWFFYGLGPKTKYKPKKGIDKDAALRHLRAIQGSWEPKHEHKEAGVAFLASLWFDDIKVVRLKERLGA